MANLIFAAKDGVMFVEVSPAWLAQDLVVCTQEIMDPMAVGPTIRGLAVSLDFPELTCELITQHLHEIVCGVLGQKAVRLEDGRMLISDLTCPVCEEPMFPYGGVFSCPECTVVLEPQDVSRIGDLIWPPFARDKKESCWVLDVEGQLFYYAGEGRPIQLAHELAQTVKSLRKQIAKRREENVRRS